MPVGSPVASDVLSVYKSLIFIYIYARFASVTVFPLLYVTMSECLKMSFFSVNPSYPISEMSLPPCSILVVIFITAAASPYSYPGSEITSTSLIFFPE